MHCPCGADHWMHIANGLRGIVDMLRNLEANKLAISKKAIVNLESQVKRLVELTERIKHVGSGNAVASPPEPHS